MASSRHIPLFVVVAVALGAPVQAGQGPPQTAPVQALTADEIEVFLREARITRVRRAGGGVTNSQRATLTDGRLTHDAHIQTVDQAMPIFQAGKASEVNFKDSYRFNVAGYKLARLLDLNVPVSVERTVNGRSAAVTWWVDDVLADEETRVKKGLRAPDAARFSQQVQVMRIFDELIQNRDRNQGNMLWTRDWTLWLIDHTRAFRLGRELLRANDIQRCDRALLERLRGLTIDGVSQAVGRMLMREEIEALLVRRDLIVARIDRLVAERGEALVLFDLARPADVPAVP